MFSSLFCQKTENRQRSDYNSPLLQYANRNRNKGYFDDITIGAGQSNFKANRMVLSCYSTFFEEKLKINEKFHKSISIDDIDEESVEAIIDFIYSGEITIDQDNVINLLNAGHKLKVVELKKFCFEYLESAVNSENCFYILDTANLYQKDSLKSKVYHCMRQNAGSVIHSLEFKKLPKQTVVEFFSIINENEFGNMMLQYEAMVTWTKHNENERMNDFIDLFHLLKIEEVSREFLVKVISRESLVHRNDACAKLVIEKLAQIVEEREFKFNQSSIICLGGWKTRSKVAEVYNLFGETAKKYPDLPVGLDSSCLLKSDNTIVCIGGDTSNRGDATNQVWQMDLKKDHWQWKEIASMNEKRCNMRATIYQDYLIVAGGYNGRCYLNSIETFIKQSNRWKVNVHMFNQARGDHAIVASDDCIYILGGWDGNILLSSVERLDGLDEEWKCIQPMNSPRSFFTAVMCQNKIFAIGGRSTKSNNNPAMKSVEMFDLSKQEWIEVKSMNVERYGHSACVLHNKVYVVGGKNNHEIVVKEIECYDITSDNWTIIARTTNEWYCHSLVAM